MLTTLPVVAVVTAIKALLELQLGWTGAVDFADVGVVQTAGVFLLGFLLTNTMADFKEAEKLPAEIASTLELLEDLLVLASSTRPSLDVRVLRKTLLELVNSIDQWFHKRIDTAGLFEALTHFSQVFSVLEQHGAGPYASRAAPQLAALRKALSRVDVISRTKFLPPAYALLETMLVLLLALLLAAKYRSLIAEFILVPVMTLINVYVLRLIHDIDDPFDYDPSGTSRGHAEVELFPLHEYKQRLAKKCEEKSAEVNSG